MEFDEFMGEQGTLKKIQSSYSGDESVADSFTVNCYFEFGSNRVVNDEGSEVAARGIVFVEPHASIDMTHRNWNFEFEGTTYDVVNMDRIKDIGSGRVSHYEMSVI